MKRKETNEKIASFIKDVADQVREDLERDVRVAYTHMVNAETQLVNSYTEEQLQLYKEYLEANQAYYDAFCLLHQKNSDK